MRRKRATAKPDSVPRAQILDRARAALPSRAGESATDARFEDAMRKLLRAVLLEAGIAQVPEFYSLVRDALKPPRRPLSARVENLAALLSCVSFPAAEDRF